MTESEYIKMIERRIKGADKRQLRQVWLFLVGAGIGDEMGGESGCRAKR